MGAMKLWLLCTLAAGSTLAQDLPDPGRRVVEDERRAEQLKRSEAEEKRGYLSAPPERPRDARACEGARTQVQLYCGGPYSPQSRSMRCTEAKALFEQAC